MTKHFALPLLSAALICTLMSCNNATDVTANRNVDAKITTNVSSMKLSNSTTNFGTLKPSASKVIDLVYENTSTTDSVKIESISLQKNNQHFSLLNLPTLPLVVAPKGSGHSSLSFNARFDATAQDGSFQDAIVLNGNATAALSLDARIFSSPPDTIDINSDCTSDLSVLNFDSLLTSMDVKTLNFVLTNHDSDSYMRIPKPTWSANSLHPFSVVSPNFPIILAPGASISVTVSARAATGGMILAAGWYNTTLSFGSAVQIANNVVVVAGQKSEIITTDVTTTMKVGSTIKLACHIINRSSQACTLSSLPTVSNAGFDCPMIIYNATLPITIQPNGAVEVIGDLTAKATGTYTEHAVFGITAGSGVVVDDACDFKITITP